MNHDEMITTQGETACAHCKVVLKHIDHPGGTRSDYWECAEGCGTKFLPAPDPAPEPVCTSCGHEAGEHTEGGGCWHWLTQSEICKCKRTREECALPAPKPEPVPPGDLTWEEARDLRNNGVVIQEDIDGCWIDVRICAGDDLIKGRAYRRKPAPRMVPLGPEDVKPGDVVRHGESKRIHPKGWARPVMVDGDGFYIARFMREDELPHPPTIYCVSWEEAKSIWEISRDGGATWQRAEKAAKGEA